MTNGQRTMAVLNYAPYDRLPIVHFGYWDETLAKWAREGHITVEHAQQWSDGNAIDHIIGRQLGFDYNWFTVLGPNTFLLPPFEEQVIEELPDGFRKVRDVEGVVVLRKKGTTSIPSEVDHTLKTRKDWEEHYLPRLQYADERINDAIVRVGDKEIRWGDGGRECMLTGECDMPRGLYCGSLFGKIRNIAGLTGVSYLSVDDEPLLTEMIDTLGALCFRCVETVLASGVKFDFAHFWEDIYFKGGPLVTPSVFREKVGPHYKRITDLLKSHGTEIVTVDCDGKIDALIPTWFENGVNTMFPIEVGTWQASIAPWREKYGRDLRGVGGMNKNVFARDFAAVDAEIERLKSLVELGGFIPCPDHRIAPDAEWDNVRYYCDRMRAQFG